jgi:hypothetical protein
MTINAAATVAAPVNGRIGSVSYSFTSPGTVALSGTCTGAVFVYVASNGANTWGHNGLACTFTPGGTVPPTIAAAVTGFPADSIPLWQLSISSVPGQWDTVTGTMDKRAAYSAAPIFAAGSNITLTPSGSTLTIASTGGGASPAGSSTELQYRLTGSTFGAVPSTYSATGGSFGTPLLTVLGEVYATQNQRIRLQEVGYGFIEIRDGSGTSTFISPNTTLGGQVNLNLGGSLAAPSLQILRDGGIRLAPGLFPAKPTCDVNIRGTLYFTPSAPGVKDLLEVCRKDAANNYAWEAIY